MSQFWPCLALLLAGIAPGLIIVLYNRSIGAMRLANAIEAGDVETTDRILRRRPSLLEHVDN